MSASPSTPTTSSPPSGWSRRRRIEEYVRTVDRNPFIPVAPYPKQRQFLFLADTREVLYGGAARGGKTYASLMAAAQYAHVPGYSALLLRENWADLMQPGAFIPVSKEWWLGRVGWNEQQKRWTFPSGATVTFGYLERDDDVYQYQGAQYQCIIPDELTHHTEWRYRYLFSRLSRPADGPLSEVPLRMRPTANPGGRGHEWVKRRFIDPATREPGAVFVPARVEDNLGVDRAAYVESLSYLDTLTRTQLLTGDWDAVEGGRFKREWFGRYTQRGDLIHVRRPGEAQGYAVNVWDCRRFATVDPAASAKTSADYTVILVWLVTPRNDLLLLDADRFQLELPEQLPRLESAYRKWKLDFAAVESVAANSALYTLARRTTMAVKALSPLSQDKLVRATAAVVLAESGRVWLPAEGLRPGSAVPDAEAEWYRFTGDDKKDANDDAVDCLSYAAKILTDGPGAAEVRRAAPHILGGGI